MSVNQLIRKQYTGLEELHKAYSDRGLEVLGFPSNEFGGQEPGTDEDVASFCQVGPTSTDYSLLSIEAVDA